MGKDIIYDLAGGGTMSSNSDQGASYWPETRREKSTEEKGQDAEEMERKFFERMGEPYIHLAEIGDDQATMVQNNDLICPDFLRVSMPAFQEKKSRDYAPDLLNLDGPHVYVRQDRMDDYIKLASHGPPVILSVYVEEESRHYWAKVTELDGKSNHDKVREDKKTVTDRDDSSIKHDVCWYSLDEFVPMEY